jgi:hypothetical protein
MKTSKILKRFKEWRLDGNVIKVGVNEYIEQSTQWSKVFTYCELKKYFIREHVNLQFSTLTEP